VSLLAYSPLGFGLLTGKYDASGTAGAADWGRRARWARIAKFESVRKQRWGRPEALVAARRYNQLARDNGLTPRRWRWRSATPAGAWPAPSSVSRRWRSWTKTWTPGARTLSARVLAEIDRIRWELRDPAL
jgi:hypothetical protein